MNESQDTIRKIYRSVALTWAIAMIWALGLGKPWIALSITLGMVLGTAVLAGFDWLVRRSLGGNGKSAGRALLKFGLMKYPLICLALYWLVRWSKVSLLAFCGGMALVHFAIIAKMAGIVLVERMNESKARAIH
jgi:hypothetical protein